MKIIHKICFRSITATQKVKLLFILHTLMHAFIQVIKVYVYAQMLRLVQARSRLIDTDAIDI